MGVPFAVVVVDGDLVFVASDKPKLLDVKIRIDSWCHPFVVDVNVRELPTAVFYDSTVLIGFVCVVYLTCRQHEAADNYEDDGKPMMSFHINFLVLLFLLAKVTISVESTKFTK